MEYMLPSAASRADKVVAHPVESTGPAHRPGCRVNSSRLRSSDGGRLDRRIGIHSYHLPTTPHVHLATPPTRHMHARVGALTAESSFTAPEQTCSDEAACSTTVEEKVPDDRMLAHEERLVTADTVCENMNGSADGVLGARRKFQGQFWRNLWSSVANTCGAELTLRQTK